MKKLLSILLIISLVFTANLFVFAKGDLNKLEDSKYTIISVEEPEGKPGAKYTFIDKDLKHNVNKPSEILHMPIAEEIYDYSYYIVDNMTLREYSCGPIHDRTFLISVARGQTIDLQESKSVSGTVSYSGTVSAGIKKVVNIELTSEVSGTYTKTWSKGLSFEGPESGSPYNSRDYYGAIDYDLYNIKVDRYDVYKIYVDGIETGERVQHFHSTEYVNNVKKPKSINYSIDYYRE